MTPAELERLVVLYNDRGRMADGIRDHGARLVAELSRTSGLHVELKSRVARKCQGSLTAGSRDSMLADLGDPPTRSAVVLQYSPFCYARWGFAPWLPTRFLRLRLRSSRPTIALVIHEPYVPMNSWRWTLMGLWQRAQLEALRLSADVIFSSIEPWAHQLRARRPERPVHHLPVGSNLPDRRGAGAEERMRMGIAEDDLVLAAFGRNHNSWLPGHVASAANAVARSGRRLVLLTLGADAPPIPGLDGSIQSFSPGFLEAKALAEKLAAADIFAAPVIDGVSTRRGTLMAALQHGVPVVGTLGPLTDKILRESDSALKLVPVDRPDLFADAVNRLAEAPEERSAVGRAGRQLYERCFDWPVTARRMLAALPVRS